MSDVIDITDVLKARRDEGVRFVAEEYSPHDPVRWAVATMKLVVDTLDQGDGYNRHREIREGRHDATISGLEEQIEYLENYLQWQENGGYGA